MFQKLSVVDASKWVSMELRVKCKFKQRQVLDSSKLKDFADDKFKFDENGEKFS